MNDDGLLTFDYGRLDGNEPPDTDDGLDALHHKWTRGDAENALATFGEVYRAQLVAAHFAERWCEAVITDDHPMARSAECKAGFEEALREIAAHLRKGDLLPGGALYQFEMDL